MRGIHKHTHTQARICICDAPTFTRDSRAMWWDSFIYISNSHSVRIAPSYIAQYARIARLLEDMWWGYGGVYWLKSMCAVLGTIHTHTMSANLFERSVRSSIAKRRLRYAHIRPHTCIYIWYMLWCRCVVAVYQRQRARYSTLGFSARYSRIYSNK